MVYFYFEVERKKGRFTKANLISDWYWVKKQLIATKFKLKNISLHPKNNGAQNV